MTFRFHKGDFHKLSDPFEAVATFGVEELQECILARFQHFATTSSSVLVPLSGGYDSRLNLALILKFLPPERIVCLHEFKNQWEYEIASQVAEVAGVPLIKTNRSSKYKQARQLSVRDDFILVAQLYRRNIGRWTCHLESVLGHDLEKMPVVGFGAEAHKGKFYRQVDDIKKDSVRIFGLNYERLSQIASLLQAPTFERFHENILAESVSTAADRFSSRVGQIDYIHYRHYVVESYGDRCRYFSDVFQVDFPFLDPMFLSGVFSLQQGDKEAFALPRTMVGSLHNELSKIPYYSANQKSTKGTVSWASRVVARGVRFFSRAPNKGQADNFTLRRCKPSSKLSTILMNLAVQPISPVRQNEAITAFNYFSLLEERFGVDFQLV